MTARTNLALAAVAVVIGAAYLYGVTLIRTLPFGDPLGPRAFPLVLGVAMLVAAALLALEALRGRAPAAPLVDDQAASTRTGLVIAGAAIAWTALYFLTFEPLGYVVASTLYVFPVAFLSNGRTIVANAVTAVLFAVVSYLMFTQLLGVRLPAGLLPF